MASIVSQQNSLSAGELSPSIFGRQDLEKWHSGTSTCRNFFANYRGGVQSRAGLAYVNTSKQQYPNPPRLIPFQFSISQGYVLEFGDHYLRFIFQGGYIVEEGEMISGISKHFPAIFTVNSHGYNSGDWIYVQDVVGMTNFNGLTWVVHSVIDANNFSVSNLFGAQVNSSGALYNPYISGGTTSRLYEITTPYAVEDLPYLKFTQSADTMTLTCVNTDTGTEYRPYSLVRHDQTNWTLTEESYGAVIDPPTNLVAKAQSSDVPTTWYSYVVTSVNGDTGEESIASDIISIQNNDISISAGTNTLTWDQVAGATSYNIYAAPASYSVESPVGAVFGFIGTSIGPSFVDANSIPDYIIVPPVHTDPFAVKKVKDVKVLTPGINYSQNTISFTVSTTTGTGFDGRPVVANGSLLGFIITNPGQDYSAGDTITFHDTGGGVATGSFEALGNPTNGEHININGVEIKFRETDEVPAYHEVPLGNTAALSLQSLAIYLNSSTEANFINATYSYDDTHLYVTYKTPGADGNTFTIDQGTTPWPESGPTLTGGGVIGTGATALLEIGPSTGTFPSVVTYFQQRRVYASSLNQPDTYWMSQPGLFTNMDSSIPVTDGDAITGTPWALQVNGIQFMVPMPGGLVVLTGKGAWQVNGGSAAAITPSNQSAVPQAYNGCNNLIAPIPNNYDILYVQAKGSIVRDLAYNFFTNIYTGTDITVLSNHLFTNYELVQWAWAEEPYKLIWIVRNDGTMLCLTYLKEQEVWSWTRHDTDGLFVSVCSVTEPPVDAVYVVSQRYVLNGWRYYVERMNDRIWTNSEDSFCVDSGVSTSLREPDATLSPQAATGLGVSFIASSSVFSSGDIGSILRVDGGQATITSVSSPTTVIADITVDLSNTVQHNSASIPVPALPGTWSVAPQVTVISGLNHLENFLVSILADGSVVPTRRVQNGMLTLDQPASLITIGLPYTCQVQTLYIDHPDNGNTTQSKRKVINSVGLVVEGTKGIQIGADQIDASTQENFANVDWVNMVEVKGRTQFTPAGQPVPLYTGPLFKNISASWSVKGQIAIQQTYPLPATILSVIAYWKPGDDA